MIRARLGCNASEIENEHLHLSRVFDRWRCCIIRGEILLRCTEQKHSTLTILDKLWHFFYSEEDWTQKRGNTLLLKVKVSQFFFCKGTQETHIFFIA